MKTDKYVRLDVHKDATPVAFRYRALNAASTARPLSAIRRPASGIRHPSSAFPSVRLL